MLYKRTFIRCFQMTK